jgi:hypothetical protein
MGLELRKNLKSASMQKVFHAAIEIFYWIAIFISPLLVGGVIALIIYLRNENLLWLSIIIASIGMVTGILFAERVRKKYGCSRYMSKISGTPDIWPDE